MVLVVHFFPVGMLGASRYSMLASALENQGYFLTGWTMADFMEERLDMPLRALLPIIQQGIINHTTYFGIRTFKSPVDAWVYQEIIFETEPDVIIEIGNANGGSTLFLAHICDLLGHGKVIGLDLSHKFVPERVRSHPRIHLIEGDACDNIDRVRRLISQDEGVLVIEDSSHTYANTLNVLKTYSMLTKPGDYFIVEDSISQHGLPSGRKPGPYEAIETFVRGNADFEIDRGREHFFITWNPKGYVKRVKLGNEGSVVDKKSRKFGGFNVRWLRLREGIRLFVPPIIIHVVEKINNRWMISAMGGKLR